MKKINACFSHVLFLLALLLEVLILHAPSTPVYAETSAEDDFADVIWEQDHFIDQDGNDLPSYYLTTFVQGYAEASDGTVSYAGMRAYFDKGQFTFSLFYPDGTVAFYNDQDQVQSGPIGIFYNDMNLQGESTIFLSPDSSEFYIDPDTKVQGTSLSFGDMVVLDMKQFGRFQFTIPVYGWEGRDGRTMLYFAFPHENSNFHELFLQGQSDNWSTPLSSDKVTSTQENPSEPEKTSAQNTESSSASAQNTGSSSASAQESGASAASTQNSASSGASGQAAASAYSNEQIERICQNYINTFNLVVPLLDQFSSNLYDDHFFLAMLNGAALIDPVCSFLDAKDAFDRLDINKMTSAQYSYYQQCDAAVNQTTLGQVINIIDMLDNMGIL